VWACVGIPPHGTTPVAFIATEDLSAGELTCKLVDPQELARGVRWGWKLVDVLEALLAG